MGMSKSIPPKKGYFPRNYVRPKLISEQSEIEKTAESRYSSALNYLKQEIYRRQFSMESCDAFDNLVDSGFAVEIKNSASGTTNITENSRVDIKYTAMIWDGSNTQTQVFSEGNLKFTVGKNQVCNGLEDGILKLKVGDEADIICAPIMAYGEAGQPPIIPPNVHIVYSIIVISSTTDPIEVDKNAEGDSLLFSNGISQRVHGSSADSSLVRKVIKMMIL